MPQTWSVLTHRQHEDQQCSCLFAPLVPRTWFLTWSTDETQARKRQRAFAHDLLTALWCGSQKTGPHPAATRTLQCATDIVVCRDDQQAIAHSSSASNKIATLRLPAMTRRVPRAVAQFGTRSGSTLSLLSHCVCLLPCPALSQEEEQKEKTRNREQETGIGSCHTEPQLDRNQHSWILSSIKHRTCRGIRFRKLHMSLTRRVRS